MCASGQADDDIIKKVFKLRSLATNYLQGCPYFLIDSVFFKKVFQNLPKISADLQRQAVNLISIHGLIDLYTEDQEVFLPSSVLQSSKKDSFLVSYLVHDHVDIAL